MRRPVLGVILSLFVILALTAESSSSCANNKNNSNGNSGSSNSSSNTNSAAPAGTQASSPSQAAGGAKAHLKAGESKKVGDVNVTLVGARIVPPTQFSKPKDGNQWVATEFSVENTTDKPYTLSTLLSLSMLDKDAHKFDVTISGADTKGTIEGTIPAKDRVAGEVVFEVPVSGAPYVVRFGQPLGGGTADWDVALP